MPDVLTPPELLALAQEGTRRLTPRERRQVITYLDERLEDATLPNIPKGCAPSNYQLADLFGVNESVIRYDRKMLIREYTDQITPQQAMSFVGEYMRGFDRLIYKADQDLAQCTLGTIAHRDAIRLLSDLHDRRLKMLQGIGAVPKELGRLNVAEEHWIATVDEAGNPHLTRKDGMPVAAGDARSE